MTITVLLPDETYSKNKALFTKLRKQYEVTNWNGAGWTGPGVNLSASFQKAALKSGKPHDYDGDIFIISGSSPFIDEFIELSISLGGSISGTQTTLLSYATKEEQVDAALREEKYRLQRSGASPAFIKKWLALHKKHITK